MTNELQLDKPAKNYSFNSTDHAWVFPPVGTAVKIDQVRDEIVSFEGILGAIVRHNAGCDSNPPNTSDLLTQCLEYVRENVSTDCESELADVLRDLYFEGSAAKLRRFAPASLAYLEPRKSIPKKSYSSVLSLGVFFSRVFMPPEFNKSTADKPSTTHILDQVMLDSLPQLKQRSDRAEPPVLRVFEDELIAQFRCDLKVLSESDGLLLSHIDSLIRLYLFQYLTELTRYLNRSVESLRVGNQCDSAALHGLHFIIEGERASASRIGVTEGWQSVRDSFGSAFAHINCLELLNHLRLPEQGPLDYAAVARLDTPYHLKMLRQLANDFVEVTSLPNNTKVKFAHGKELIADVNAAGSCAEGVYAIWHWIDHEINHSVRGRVVNDIAKWFSGFGHGTLLQQRGPLGYISVLPLAYLHLLVAVVVRSTQDKRVRLKDLWAGLTVRGVLLDEGSKRAVISNLEEIGVLEAKSDSGDARYVRAPF
jgi:DNA phosphorothioation-dependent restriction protein DptG